MKYSDLTTEELEKILTVLANRFYVDEPFEYNEDIENVSDEIYDSLVEKWETSTGRSVKELVKWDDGGRFQTACLVPHLPKDKYKRDEILACILNDNAGSPYYVTYKYDGCAISAYYTESGILSKILGTPDEQWGFLRTGKMFKLFPRVLPAPLRGKVRAMYGEFLVDATLFGELSRNKANGLCNSKYMDEEINSLGIVRIYNMTFWNEPTDIFEKFMLLKDSLKELNNIVDHDNPQFAPCEILEIDQINGEPIIEERISNFHLQVDGYVVYSSKTGNFAYKLYYTDSTVVSIENVEWNYNVENGSYVPVLCFEPVEINGKTVSKCSTGGVPRLLNEKIGIGAKVKLILSGGVIPKIIEVLEGSEEYNFPTCECGHQLTAADVIGSVLKCSNPDCTLKCNALIGEVLDTLNGKSLEEYIDEDLFFLIRLLKIDRFKPEQRFKEVSSLEEACRIVDRSRSTEIASIQATLQNKGLSEEEIVKSLNLIESYKTSHSDQDFDEASDTINNYIIKYQGERTTFAKRFKESCIKLIINPSKEALLNLLDGYFATTKLMYKNAEVNALTVINVINYFKNKEK